MLENHPKIRLALYLLSLVGAVAAPVLAVTHPEYGAAVTTAAGILTAAAGATALSNVAPAGPVVVQEVIEASPAADDGTLPDGVIVEYIDDSDAERAAELGLGKHSRVE